MTGHVFHPGHAELHGITVVVETRGPHTYVGRYDREDETGVHLLNVGLHHESAAGISKAEFLKRTATYGIRSDLKHLVLPSDQVVSISRLADFG